MSKQKKDKKEDDTIEEKNIVSGSLDDESLEEGSIDLATIEETFDDDDFSAYNDVDNF